MSHEATSPEAPPQEQGSGFNRNTITKGLAALAALFVIGGGAALVSNASNDNGANAAARSGPPGAQAAQQGAQGARPGAQGAPPAGFGTEATGQAAEKAKAAALAKYPGTAERVMTLPNGSYVVHVERSSGEVHVLVSSDFQVQGIDQGPPAGAGPNGGGAPPAPPGSNGGATPAPQPGVTQ